MFTERKVVEQRIPRESTEIEIERERESADKERCIGHLVEHVC